MSVPRRENRSGPVILGWYSKRQEITYNALVALGDSPSWEDIRAVSGMKNFNPPKPVCEECKTPVDIAVTVGEEPDMDSHTAILCLPCLEKAVAMAKQEIERGAYRAQASA